MTRLEFFDCLMETEDTLKYKTWVEKGNYPKTSLGAQYRQFKPIVLGDIHLSIQGSYHHYCTPQETFENPTIYDSMEVGILRVEDGERDWVDLDTDKVFHGLLAIEVYRDYKEQNGLYSYLPVELIENLYQYLKALDLHTRRREGITDGD